MILKVARKDIGGGFDFSLVVQISNVT
jgi:hypothetical protein